MPARASTWVSWLTDWLGACAATFAPLVTLIRTHVTAAKLLDGDDTAVPVLTKGQTIIGPVSTYETDRSRSIGPDCPVRQSEPPTTILRCNRHCVKDIGVEICSPRGRYQSECVLPTTRGQCCYDNADHFCKSPKQVGRRRDNRSDCRTSPAPNKSICTYQRSRAPEWLGGFAPLCPQRPRVHQRSCNRYTIASLLKWRGRPLAQKWPMSASVRRTGLDQVRS